MNSTDQYKMGFQVSQIVIVWRHPILWKAHCS